MPIYALSHYRTRLAVFWNPKKSFLHPVLEAIRDQATPPTDGCGPWLSDLFHSVAVTLKRSSRGSKRAATKFQLIINHKIANTLGLSFPQTLLTVAEEVIE